MTMRFFSNAQTVDRVRETEVVPQSRIGRSNSARSDVVNEENKKYERKHPSSDTFSGSLADIKLGKHRDPLRERVQGRGSAE
jgi:hypothetical protein